MNKKLFSFLFLATVLTVIGVYSCKQADEPQQTPDPATNYYPLQVGKYIVYDVDSTIWDDTVCVVLPKHSQIMYMVADSFKDEKGRTAFRIDKRWRKKVEDKWANQDVIYATNTGLSVEVEESGLRFIKLVYPVSEGRSWKGNSFINIEDPEYNFFNDWNYTYYSLGNNFNTGDVNYNNTVTVHHADETLNNPEEMPKSFASRTFSKEVYASGLGMVYREYYRWIYDPSTATPSKNACRRGTGVLMRAVDHN
jgi:hypothetical protein